MQRACKSLHKDVYEPMITFLVVQKRHNTQIFPKDFHLGVSRLKNVSTGISFFLERTSGTVTVIANSTNISTLGEDKHQSYRVSYQNYN